MARVGQIEPLEIVWRPYELRPEGAPPPPAEYIERAWQQSVRPLAQQLGVTMNQPSKNPSTRLTHEAVAYAIVSNSGTDGDVGDAVGSPEIRGAIGDAAEQGGDAGSPGDPDAGANADAFIMAVFKAYWEDDRDIGDIDVLCALAKDIGLDDEGMRLALTERVFAPYVDEQIQLARTKYQVSAVPTLIIANKYRIRGLPMEEQLLEAVRHAKAE